MSKSIEYEFREKYPIFEGEHALIETVLYCNGIKTNFSYSHNTLYGDIFTYKKGVFIEAIYFSSSAARLKAIEDYNSSCL